MSNKKNKNNLFLSSIKSSGSKSNITELGSSSSAASSPSNASTYPASPAPDLLFVNRTYRENLHAWHSLAPEVFHAGTTRSPSPAVATAPSPSAALDINNSSLYDNEKTIPLSSTSPSVLQRKHEYQHRKHPSLSADTFLSFQKDPSVAQTANAAPSHLTPKRGRKISLPNEKRRMKILRELDLLDSAPEEAFDRITNLASRIFKCPIALISFMDETSQFFKSRLGSSTTKWPRDVSFNSLTFLDDREGVIVIRDTHYDDRFEPIAEEAQEAPQKEDNSCSNDNRHIAEHHRCTPSGSVNTDIQPPFISNVHDNENYIGAPTYQIDTEGESGKYQLSCETKPDTNLSLIDLPALNPAFYHVHHLPQEIAQISKSPAEIPRHHSLLHYHQFRLLKAHVRFFATTNIFVNRVKIGCLTICDVVPHYHFSSNDELMLLDLAGMISDLLEDRRNLKAEEEKKTFQTQQEALLRIQAPLQKVCYCAELMGQGISEVFYGPNELDTCAIYNDDLFDATTNYIIRGDLRNGTSVTINTADVNVDSTAAFMTEQMNSESTDIACISSVTMEDTVVSNHADALSADTSPSSSDKRADNDPNATTINNESSVKKNFQLSVVTDRTIATDKEVTFSFNTHVASQKNGTTSWYLSPHLAASQYHLFSASSDMDTPMTGPSIKLNNMDVPYPLPHHMNTNVHPFLPTYPPSIDNVNVGTHSTLLDDSEKEENQEEYPLYSYPNKDIFLQGVRDHVVPALQAFVSAVHYLDTTIEHTLVQHLQAFWTQRQRSHSQSSSEGCSLSCTPLSNGGSSSNTPHGSDSSDSTKSDSSGPTEKVPSGSSSTALVATVVHNNVNPLWSANYVDVNPVLKFDGGNSHLLPMRTSGPLYSGISPLSSAGTIAPIKTASKVGVVNSAYADNLAKYE